MTAPDLSNIEQLPQPDPRGWLAMNNLPPSLENAENSTAVADKQRGRWRPRGFGRDATDCERLLLEWLGHGPLPDDLTTTVMWLTNGVRNRRWPSLEEGSTS